MTRANALGTISTAMNPPENRLPETEEPQQEKPAWKAWLLFSLLIAALIGFGIYAIDKPGILRTLNTLNNYANLLYLLGVVFAGSAWMYGKLFSKD